MMPIWMARHFWPMIHLWGPRFLRDASRWTPRPDSACSDDSDDTRDVMTVTTRCVEVALAVPLFRTFTYLVPEGIATPIPPGSRVLVPFRARREVGICLGAAEPREGVTL